MENRKKFLALACLYTAQLIPGHFATNALPVIMRNEGFSLRSIGFAGMISMPWALKFLWSPVVDRWGRGKNHYRKWIFVMQILFASATLASAFFSLNENFMTVIMLMTLSYFFASTQDIAVDAYAVKMLEPAERGVGNGIQAGGNMLGVVLGSSLALILYIRTSWGTTLVTLFIVTMLLSAPLIFSGEEKSPDPVRAASYRDIVSFFRISGIKRLIPVMLLAFGGVFSAMTMIKPLMIDQGYSWNFISAAIGLYPLAGVPAALTAGFAVKKYGRRKVMLASSAFQIFACLMLVPVASGNGGIYLIQVAMCVVFISFSLLLTVFNTIAMDFARKGREGTDFTMFMSVTFFGGMFIAGISGAVAQYFGYVILFLLCSFICLLVYLLLENLFHNGRIADTEECESGCPDGVQ
ncbi:MFS transporter [Geovibrio thiophilus]|uniref:MFS transporter n=1 Tax=Geovibrio thiophilus TaxID=139438 RepID=A0A410JZM6_9BACT|nr:MFS transporter [Geovibrio thiophilus]QAR33511.1 MFS transporter [Geovibrio thiophilus]